MNKTRRHGGITRGGRKLYLYISITLILVAGAIIVLYSHYTTPGEREVEQGVTGVTGDWYFSCHSEDKCIVVINILNRYNETIEIIGFSIMAYVEGSPRSIGSIVINETVKPGLTRIQREVTGYIAQNLVRILREIAESGYQAIPLPIGILYTNKGRVVLEIHSIPI